MTAPGTRMSRAKIQNSSSNAGTSIIRYGGTSSVIKRVHKENVMLRFVATDLAHHIKVLQTQLLLESGET
jgi:hypothetical protein